MPSNVKSKEGSRRKTKSKKKSKGSREHSLDGSEGDLELDRELYPIGHYLYDRAEMVKQMFGVLKKDKIQSMLPPILKEIQWPDLKTHCLEQLNSMSEKQIIRIIGGKPYAPELENDVCDKTQSVDLVSSSSSSSSATSSNGDSSSNGSDSESEAVAGSVKKSLKSPVEIKADHKAEAKKSDKPSVLVKPDTDKLEDDPDMLQIGLSPKEMGDLLGDEEELEKKDKEQKGDLIDARKNIKEQHSIDAAACGKKTEAKGGKTLLEILELEMRARAIRALLKQSSASKTSDGSNPAGSGSTKKTSSSPETKILEGIEIIQVSKSQKNVPVVIIKDEEVSDEDDVVFVNESPSKPLCQKESKKIAQKECLSAVYDASTDILKFKPTVMSTTSKVSLVDTSGNPIVLPKVKAQAKIKIVDPNVIVIDNDVPDRAQAKSKIVDPNVIVIDSDVPDRASPKSGSKESDREGNPLKRKSNSEVDMRRSGQSKSESNSKATDKCPENKSGNSSQSKDTKISLTHTLEVHTPEESTVSASSPNPREEIIMPNGKKVILESENIDDKTK